MDVVSTASDRITSVGNDVSLTSGVLQQLGELMTQKATDDDDTSIFSQASLVTTKSSAEACARIFQAIEKEMKAASEQLRGPKRHIGRKVLLSRYEQLKWPFLQPGLDVLRSEMREAKGTLMLTLQVTTLGFARKVADSSKKASMSILADQRDLIQAVLALRQEQQQTSMTNDTSRHEPPTLGQLIEFSRSPALGVTGPLEYSNKVEILRPYVLKPKARDLDDTVEISWDLQAEVRSLEWQSKVLAEVEDNVKRSSLPLASNLLPREARAIDEALYAAGPESSLVSSEKWEWDFPLGKMRFLQVPGLRFIVRAWDVELPRLNFSDKKPSFFISQGGEFCSLEESDAGAGEDEDIDSESEKIVRNLLQEYTTFFDGV